MGSVRGHAPLLEETARDQPARSYDGTAGVLPLGPPPGVRPGPRPSPSADQTAAGQLLDGYGDEAVAGLRRPRSKRQGKNPLSAASGASGPLARTLHPRWSTLRTSSTSNVTSTDRQAADHSGPAPVRMTIRFSSNAKFTGRTVGGSPGTATRPTPPVASRRRHSSSDITSKPERSNILRSSATDSYRLAVRPRRTGPRVPSSRARDTDPRCSSSTRVAWSALPA